MLLVEWWAHWRAMAPIEADGLLALYQVALLSDSGWKLDREVILGRWRELAADANAVTTTQVEQFDPKDPLGISRQVRGLFRWLATQFGDGVGPG